MQSFDNQIRLREYKANVHQHIIVGLSRLSINYRSIFFFCVCKWSRFHSFYLGLPREVRFVCIFVMFNVVINQDGSDVNKAMNLLK